MYLKLHLDCYEKLLWASLPIVILKALYRKHNIKSNACQVKALKLLLFFGDFFPNKIYLRWKRAWLLLTAFIMFNSIVKHDKFITWNWTSKTAIRMRLLEWIYILKSHSVLEFYFHIRENLHNSNIPNHLMILRMFF